MRVIYCAGDQGRVVADILRANGGVEDVVFIDDETSQHGTRVAGITVVGDLSAVSDVNEETHCIVAFGSDPKRRLELAASVRAAGHDFFNAVHPDASISTTTELGTGITVNAQSYLGPHVSIQDHVLVDSLVNLSHDVVVDEGASITPGVTIAGGVTIGKGVYLGPNSTILRGVSVGDSAVVGAGAVVTENVPAGVTVVGVPAEPM